MKTTWKSVLSLLLVLALLLPVLPAAHAENDDPIGEVGLTLSPDTGVDIFYRDADGSGSSVKITATAGDDAYNGNIMQQQAFQNGKLVGAKY